MFLTRNVVRRILFIASFLIPLSLITCSEVKAISEPVPCLNAYQDIQMKNDLNCDRDAAIIVQKDNILIDLNGHTINGPGRNIATVGVVIPNSDHVRIIDGLIKNFEVGVLITGSDDTNVTGLTLENNKNGIFLTDSAHTNIKKNTVRMNGVGIDAHTSDFVNVSRNALLSNNEAGVKFTNVDYSEISTNKIDHSTLAMSLDSSSGNNKIESNNLSNNTLDINRDKQMVNK